MKRVAVSNSMELYDLLHELTAGEGEIAFELGNDVRPLSPIDLSLIKDAANSKDIKLIFHTAEPAMREMLTNEGLNVSGGELTSKLTERQIPHPSEIISNATLSQQKPKFLSETRNVESNAPLIKFNPKNLIYVGIIALVVLVLGFYFFVPQATITVKPETRNMTISKNFTIQDGLKEPLPASASVPGQLVQVKKEKNQQFAATGESKARGAVLFSNSANGCVDLGAGTLIQNGGEVYTADTSFRVCKEASASQTDSVNVTSTKGGADYNVAKDAGNFTIEDYSSLSGVSLGITGGEKKIVTKTDLVSAQKKLVDLATKEATTDLTKNLPEGKLVESTIKKEIEARAVPKEGGTTAAGKFEMFVSVTLFAMVFNENDVTDILRMVADSSIKDGETVYSFDKEKVTYAAVKGGELNNGKVTISASIIILAGAKIDTASLKKDLKGKSRTEAAKLLNDLTGVRDYSIDVRPGWITSIPQLQSHIKINLVVE